MELSNYARAIAGRWVWVVTGATVGVLLGVVVAGFTPAAYTARVTLYVDAAVVADEQDPSAAARLRTAVLPSIAALASASSVLTEVAATAGLEHSPAALAATLDVTVERETSVLHIAATRATPGEATTVARAVGGEVERRAVELLTGSDGPQLRVSLVQDAAEPASVSRPATVLAALGALGGAGAGGLAAGLAELARPRVRGRNDVARLTSAPVLAVLPAPRPASPRRAPEEVAPDQPRRAAELERLRWALRCAADDWIGRRVALVGAAADVGSLAAEITTRGLDVTAIGSAHALAEGEPFDGVVVVVDGRRTTVRDLAATLAVVDHAGAPLVGVVVDGLLPPASGWRARFRAGTAGHATWLLDGAANPPVPSSAGRRATAPAGMALTRAVAVLAVAAVGYTRPLPMGLSTGLLAAAALLPVWLPCVRRHRGATPLLVLAVVGLLAGTLVAWSLSGDHEFALFEASARASSVLGMVGGVGVLLWARGILPLPVLGTAFGLGMLLTELADAPGTENLWKFQLSSPLMVIALSLAARAGRPLVSVAVLGALALVNVTHDARSAFGFCAVGAALVLWQQRPGGNSSGHRGRKWLTFPALALLGAGGYWVLTRLMIAGALGAEVQQRTATQIAQTGSLLLGGRPEWTVTWALMHTHPFGLGLGTVPNAGDVLVAKAAIAVTNIPTAESYVENYMLANGVQLHSIVADLWAFLGPAGVLLGLVMGALVLLGLADQLARRQASGLVCLLVPTALWGLLFGPMASNADTLVLALGLLLLPRDPRPRSGATGSLAIAAGAGPAALPPRRLVTAS